MPFYKESVVSGVGDDAERNRMCYIKYKLCLPENFLKHMRRIFANYSWFCIWQFLLLSLFCIFSVFIFIHLRSASLVKTLTRYCKLESTSEEEWVLASKVLLLSPTILSLLLCIKFHPYGILKLHLCCIMLPHPVFVEKEKLFS